MQPGSPFPEPNNPEELDDSDLDALLLAQMREDFLLESREILDSLEELLTDLEQDPSPEVVKIVFRHLHTLKGTAGFAGLGQIQKLSHRLEDLFDLVRNDELVVTVALVNLTFQALQHLEQMRQNVASGHTELENLLGLDQLMADINQAMNPPPPSSQENLEETDVEAPEFGQTDLETGSDPSAPDQSDPEQSNPDENERVSSQTERAEAPADAAPSPVLPPASPSASSSASSSTQTAKPATGTKSSAPGAVPENTMAWLEQEVSAPVTANSTLRVQVRTMDDLMLLAGELITSRNALRAAVANMDEETLNQETTSLSRLAGQLQRVISSVRLIPIEQLLNRFSGQVRNLARIMGKEVELVIDGGETPFDRTISEQIYEPMLHLLRNSIDHGIETPQERIAMGKPAVGTIIISAERRGNRVVIRFADDGAGINPDKIREKAIAQQLISAEEAAEMTDNMVNRLIFLSGLSTTAEVTNLSGRGVGMDIVAQTVRQLRGIVDIQTMPGEGTEIILELPLTMATLDVLLVRVGQYIYALPLHVVRETMLLQSADIQTMQQREVTFVRGVPLTLYHLREWLGHQMEEESPAAISGYAAIVVRQTLGYLVLIVDELVGKQQVVLKTLTPYLGNVPGVEGTAILPDGKVTLVLDIEKLVQADSHLAPYAI